MSTMSSLASAARSRIRVWLLDWPLWTLAVVLISAFAAQVLLLPGLGLAYALSAGALKAGRWWTLFTSMFLHAGLLHLICNLSALSLGRPALQRFGSDLHGVGLFLMLYLLSGLAGGLAFVALDPNGTMPAVGASGALFGLWGAAARIGLRGEPLEPLFSRAVGRQIWDAIRANLWTIGLFFVLSATNGGQGPRLAWQAHAGGFLAGLLLIEPLLKMARPKSGEVESVLSGRIFGQYGDETFSGTWTLRGDTIVLSTPVGSCSGTVNRFESPQQAAERIVGEIYRGRPSETALRVPAPSE